MLNPLENLLQWNLKWDFNSPRISLFCTFKDIFLDNFFFSVIFVCTLWEIFSHFIRCVLPSLSCSIDNVSSGFKFFHRMWCRQHMWDQILQFFTTSDTRSPTGPCTKDFNHRWKRNLVFWTHSLGSGLRWWWEEWEMRTQWTENECDSKEKDIQSRRKLHGIQKNHSWEIQISSSVHLLHVEKERDIE